MKRTTLLVLLAPFMLLLAACANVNEDPGAADGLLEPGATNVPLYAPGDLRVGEVRTADDGETLTVAYEVTEPGWCLVRTDVQIAASVGDLGGVEAAHFGGRGGHGRPGHGDDRRGGDDRDDDRDRDDDDRRDDDDWWDDDRWDDDRWDDDRRDDDRRDDDGWDDDRWDDDRWDDWWDDDEDHDDDRDDGRDDGDDDDGEKDDGHDGDDGKHDDRDDEKHDEGGDDGEGDGSDDGGDDGTADEPADDGDAPSEPSEPTAPATYTTSADHDCLGSYEYEIPLDAIGDVDTSLSITTHAVVAETGGGTCEGGMYGLERDSGAIYRIDDVIGQEFEEVAVHDESPGDADHPDGLAFDAANGRVYVADLVGGATELAFLDLASGSFVPAGGLVGTVTNAAIHDGAYYYVPHASDELHRVTFASDGTVATDEVVAGFEPPAPLEVVDLAFRDGVMYGSTTIGPTSADSTARFFTFDLATNEFDTPSTGGGAQYLQIAFDATGTLYGTFTDDTVFYEIDPATGDTTSIETWPQRNFTDLASSFDCGTTSTRTESAWAGEEAVPGAENGATYFDHPIETTI